VVVSTGEAIAASASFEIVGVLGPGTVDIGAEIDVLGEMTA